MGLEDAISFIGKLFNEIAVWGYFHRGAQILITSTRNLMGVQWIFRKFARRSPVNSKVRSIEDMAKACSPTFIELTKT